MGYILNNGYQQMKLLNSRVAVEKIIADPKIEADVKRKLKLAIEAKEFAENELHLKKTKNYLTYVDLHRPYVTYIVSAAPKNELKYYTWYFPIIGSVPYKGYFTEKGARDEAKDLADEGYDTYVRGVSAYSTLGWFNDPILSSMMRYSDYDLVNTIIHETVHATLYIADNANFNERLATYLGDLGASLFYKKIGNGSAVLTEAEEDSHDQKLFSEFISKEIKDLEDWYGQHKEDAVQGREARFTAIKEKYKKDLKPKLKSNRYDSFADAELNNAKLLGYKLYMNDLNDFEKLSAKLDHDFQKILDFCKGLEKEKAPEDALKKFIDEVPR
ncbi:MAG: aminopeptidase [Bdellovibrionales bacterium]|nr:aminopeptidase [Bdellovibrionales bacterium]